MRNAYPGILAFLLVVVLGQGHAQVAKTPADPRPVTAPNADTPLFEVYQVIFVLLFPRPAELTTEEGKSSAAARLEAIGLDREAAKSLAGYASAGLAQQRDYSDTQIVELCRRKTTLTSKSQLGDAFAAIYDGLDRLQQKSWGSFDFLDRKNRSVLSAYAAKRKQEVQIRGNDPRAVIERSPETLQQFLGRVCAGK